MNTRLPKRPQIRLLALLAVLCTAFTCNAQEENREFPMGPIGARMKIQTGKSYVRVSNVLPGSPAEAAGLQINDFVYGAFNLKFDPISDDYLGNGGVFTGCVRQLGNAIDRAEYGDGVLPLMVLRPSAGAITITVNLIPQGILTPAHPLTSAKYALAYEHACNELHQAIMNDSDGNIRYLTGFIGLSLLGHPNWNDTTGSKPYRLSLDKMKDFAVGKINNAWYAPFENLLLDLYEADGVTPKQPSTNPNPIPASESLGNWELGGLSMFLAEYYTKTQQAGAADPAVFAALQRSAELSANRIQNWKQPPGTNPWGRNPSYENRRGQTGHGNVTGDYMHYDFGGGINMAGVHLFSGLALAKRAGVDMSVKPEDGKHFGYPLNPGDPRPATIADAVPDTITFPRNGEDQGGYNKISLTASVPADPQELVTDPFYYNWDLRQKFWLKWEFLRRSSSSSGYVNYAAGTGAQFDASGRTAGALFGIMAYTDGTPPTPEDQAQAELQKTYLAKNHEISLNAHAYNSGGALFYALAAPYLSDRQQRFYLHNWRFRHNFMREHDGTLSYFSGRKYTDPYIDTSVSALVHIALPRSVAVGGLPHVPGYTQNRIFAQFHMPGLSWPTIEARKLTVTDSLTINLNAELIDTSGNAIAPSSSTTTWSVISGPATSGIIANPSNLVTTATFPQPGTYRLQLVGTHGGLTTTELIDVDVSAFPIPAGWQQGSVNYEIYNINNPSSVASLTGDASYPDSPTQSYTLPNTSGNKRGSDYGSRLSGYILAPSTGTYSIYIAGNDHAELFFNPTASTGDQVADQAGLTSVATASSTGFQEWHKDVAQKYDVSLVAGELYYFEALQVENSGSDHLDVGWTIPGGSTIENINSIHLVIPGDAEVPPAIVTHPTDQNVTLGSTVTFTIVTEGPAIGSYQWRHNGVNIGLASSDPTLTLVNVGGALEGTYDCIYTASNSVITSNSATLSFTDPGYGTLMMGGLWEEEFYGIKGQTIASLTESPKYPLYSDSSQVITSTENAPPADDSGRRWSGWIVPTETANYRFFVATRDNNELYFSPDEYEGHKRLVSSHNGSLSSRSWQNAVPTEWFPLEAGQRYFIELLHKNDGSGDHAGITWQKEGDPDPLNGDAPIPGTHLQYRLGGYYEDAIDIAPIALDDTAFAPSETPIVIESTANDLDNDPSQLTVATFTQPANGLVSLNGTTFTYTSNDGFQGIDTFTYTIQSANGLFSSPSSPATVSVTVIEPLNGTIARQRFDLDIFTSSAEGAMSDGAESGDRYFNSGAGRTHTSTGPWDLGFSHRGVMSSSGGIAGVVGGAFQLIHYSSNSNRSSLAFGNPRTGVMLFDQVDLTGYASKSFSMDLGNLGSNGNDDDVVVSLIVNNADGSSSTVTLVDTRPQADGVVVGADLTPSYNFLHSDVSAQLQIDILADDSADGYSFDNIVFSGSAMAPNADTDADGIADAWEYLHSGNITALNPTTDEDGDGRSNLDEYRADTNPVDKNSNFRISAIIEPTADNWSLTVPETSTMRVYTLYQSSDLGATDPWTPVPGQINIPGTNGPLIFNFSNATDIFYRVHADLP